jgi:hypothetical protein
MSDPEQIRVRPVQRLTQRDIQTAAGIAEIAVKENHMTILLTDGRILGPYLIEVTDGIDGQDYVLTDADRREIARQVVEMIPVPEDGEDGEDGKDYRLTHQDMVEIAALIPRPRDGKDFEMTEDVLRALAGYLPALRGMSDGFEAVPGAQREGRPAPVDEETHSSEPVPGPMGPMPKHEFDPQKVRLRFETAPGVWGEWINLFRYISKKVVQVSGGGGGGGATTAKTDDITVQGNGSSSSPIRLKRVFTDNTLTGKGTQAEPLSVSQAASIGIRWYIEENTVVPQYHSYVVDELEVADGVEFELETDARLVLV